MNYSEESYRNMLASFRTSDLQSLLGFFGRNKNGRKSELKDRALELLRTKPTSFTYQSYLSKILEIYRSMQVDPSGDTMRNMMQSQQRQMMNMGMQDPQQRFYQPPPQYTQQPIHMARAGLPQVMPQIQRGMYGNSMGGNNIQYAYQPAGPRRILSQGPPNQMNVVGSDPMLFNMNASNIGNINPVAPTTQALLHVKFKKLPFYEVIDEVIKPSIITGVDRCSLPNSPRGMREATFKFYLGIEQANYISLNRDISNQSKIEFPYQIQIRICLLETEASELSDLLPLGLHVRVGSKICPLPPTAPNTRPGTEARRSPRPISITNYIKLNPTMANTIYINWTPDGKQYVFGIYYVKKLSSEILLNRLQEKGARSSEETKNDIIKKLADVDPDLATTSYRVSLMCPLGKKRMKFPAKSVNCDHLQCFDASTYIIMNEKKPTWMCPTCPKSCVYDDIQIESYFLEVISNPNVADSAKEIEILADGTWKVYDEKKEPNVEAALNTKDKPIDSVNLDESDDETMTEPKKEPIPESSKEGENMKSSFVDLTLSDEEELTKEKDKLENEAQAADAAQPPPVVDTKPQVQPQQAVTSSEQGVVIEIDSPSPPTSPIPVTTAS